MKLVHFFPAFATLAMLFTLLANIAGWHIAVICNILWTVYILLIFFHSWLRNKSAKIALLSIAAAFTQLTGYGLGFMQDYWLRVILKRS